MNGLLDLIADAYQRNVGNPSRQLVGGGLRGLLGLDMPEYADNLGREAYRNAAAIGMAPGVNAPVGAFKAAAKVVPEAAMFIGALAKTWDKASNAKAVQMEKAGKDAREIWRETGNLKGPDGKWRQEISDHNIRPLARTWGEGKDLEAGSSTVTKRQRALAHPELSAAYPDTKGIIVSMRPGESGNASFSSGGVFGDEIALQVSPRYGHKANPSTMIHELQHAIQQREGFARGGSPELFTQQAEAEKARDLLNWRREVNAKLTDTGAKSWDEAERAVINDYKAVGAPDWIPNEQVRKMARSPQDYFESPPEEFVKLYGLDKRTTPYSAQDAYRRLAGEAEARATQSRMNMTPAERRATFPFDSYDVPVNELIVRGLLGP